MLPGIPARLHKHVIRPVKWLSFSAKTGVLFFVVVLLSTLAIFGLSHLPFAKVVAATTLLNIECGELLQILIEWWKTRCKVAAWPWQEAKYILQCRFIPIYTQFVGWFKLLMLVAFLNGTVLGQLCVINEKKL